MREAGETEPRQDHQSSLQPQASSAAAQGVSGTRSDVGQSSLVESPSKGPSVSGGPQPLRLGHLARHHRTNPSSTLRYSQISATSTSATGQSSSGRPQRKKSTLRGALSRLFGRRKKTASQDSSGTEPVSDLASTQLHRSVSVVILERANGFANFLPTFKQAPSALGEAKEHDARRAASLPITEYDRALRSHSVGPEDMNAIESARTSLQADLSPGRKRAATTSGKVPTQPRRAEQAEWTGLSPRPASAHGRGSRPLSVAADEDPNEIGRAITSDHVAEYTHRRRSRSLSGLPDLAEGTSHSRRRSDEIRYWRESYGPGFMSPLSSGNEADYGDNGDDDTGAVSFSMPDSPTAEHPPPKTPPQPFTFGSIASMNEMAGMKITQAASFEARFGSLEARLTKLERVVSQLCHAVPGFRGPLMELAPTDRSAPRSTPSGPDAMFAYTSAAAPPVIPAAYQAASADPRGAGLVRALRHRRGRCTLPHVLRRRPDVHWLRPPALELRHPVAVPYPPSRRATGPRLPRPSAAPRACPRSASVAAQTRRTCRQTCHCSSRWRVPTSTRSRCKSRT